MSAPTDHPAARLTRAQIERIREVYPLDRPKCPWCSKRAAHGHHFDCPVPDIHALLAELAYTPAPAVPEDVIGEFCPACGAVAKLGGLYALKVEATYERQCIGCKVRLEGLVPYRPAPPPAAVPAPPGRRDAESFLRKHQAREHRDADNQPAHLRAQHHRYADKFGDAADALASAEAENEMHRRARIEISELMAEAGVYAGLTLAGGVIHLQQRAERAEAALAALAPVAAPPAAPEAMPADKTCHSCDSPDYDVCGCYVRCVCGHDKRTHFKDRCTWIPCMCYEFRPAPVAPSESAR